MLRLPKIGTKGALLRYGVSVVSVAVAFLARLLLTSVVGSPYVTFFFATVSSALFGGFGPGVAATVIGGIVARYFIPSAGSGILFPDPADPSGFVRFLVTNLFVGYVVSALVRSRENVRSSEARLQLALETSRMVAWEWNPESGVLVVTGPVQQIYGTALAEAVPMSLSSLHPSDAREHQAQVQKIARKGGSYHYEFRVPRPDTGQVLWLEERASAVKDDVGRVVRLVGIVIDISRLKATDEALQRQAEDLRRSNRELEQFAYVASHDMQEPLRIVNAYTELMLRKIDVTRTAELDQYAGFIRAGVHKMEQLIRDLLSFSRMVHSEVEVGPVDASESLRKALAICQPMIEESGAEVTSNVLPVVLAEEGPLVQVFQNLIGNAVKYRKSGVAARVRISAEEHDRVVTFSVEDSGIGFDPRYAKTIFGLFKRLHRDEYPGTGLGLAICQRILERYEGRIWAESKVGEGSTFFFTIPAVTVLTPTSVRMDSGHSAEGDPHGPERTTQDQGTARGDFPRPRKGNRRDLRQSDTL
jgi:PAS domain S-box-containing protein